MKTIIYKPSRSCKEHFLEIIHTHIESNLDDTNYRIETLAADMNLSRQQLYRKTKQWTGISISSYVRSIRLQFGKALLQNTNHKVSDIAYQVGFSDPSYFSKSFSTTFGYAPSENRNRIKEGGFQKNDIKYCESMFFTLENKQMLHNLKRM